ncbi:TPA: hypothetical protein DEP58_01020 [Patescibacteria group bacterium]|nr:MAG: hypothetical protein UU98_C0033G0006 [Parcubacteria group bacterium GW2011_GWD2_42_14]HCC04871.1 hypothetical protein [Patescibacteria group bacterium]
MSKYSRSGGKYTGNHSTLIPLACMACDFVYKFFEVNKISPGFIKSGLRSVNGNRNVKISSESCTCVLLSIRDNTSFQEVRVYTNDMQNTKLELARKLRNCDVPIRFTKEI